MVDDILDTDEAVIFSAIDIIYISVLDVFDNLILDYFPAVPRCP